MFKVGDAVVLREPCHDEGVDYPSVIKGVVLDNRYPKDGIIDYDLIQVKWSGLTKVSGKSYPDGTWWIRPERVRLDKPKSRKKEPIPEGWE